MSFVILFLAALLGGLLPLKMGQRPALLKLLLGFSGAFLFGICLLHLIPDAYQRGGEFTGIWIMAGFTLQVFLEQFSGGAEHGHFHKDYRGSFPYLLVLSLCLHAFLEGMPLGFDAPHTEGYAWPLILGVALHHIPAAFVLGSMLIMDQKASFGFWTGVLLFALMTPLGMFFGDQSVLTGGKLFPVIMGVVIGIFIHLSTTILFESGQDHRYNLKKGLAILAGAGLSLLTLTGH